MPKTESKAKKPEQIAKEWVDSLFTTAARMLALKKAFPDAKVRYRRVAPTGPNSLCYMLAVFRTGKQPETLIWSELDFENHTNLIPDEEIIDELNRWARCAE